MPREANSTALRGPKPTDPHARVSARADGSAGPIAVTIDDETKGNIERIAVATEAIQFLLEAALSGHRSAK